MHLIIRLIDKHGSVTYELNLHPLKFTRIITIIYCCYANKGRDHVRMTVDIAF